MNDKQLDEIEKNRDLFANVNDLEMAIHILTRILGRLRK